MTSSPIDFDNYNFSDDKRESISREVMSLYWVSEGVDNEKRLRNGDLQVLRVDIAFALGSHSCPSLTSCAAG